LTVEMLITYALAMLLILALLLGWVGVQHASRSFAARHPEFGPAREEGGGCGGLLCLCKNGQECPKDKLKQALRRNGKH